MAHVGGLLAERERALRIGLHALAVLIADREVRDGRCVAVISAAAVPMQHLLEVARNALTEAVTIAERDHGRTVTGICSDARPFERGLLVATFILVDLGENPGARGVFVALPALQ